MYSKDQRIVITLDAGGTNFVFGAIQANQFIIEPVSVPSQADQLDRCLANMVAGFTRVMDQLKAQQLPAPVAISFAFPGPADYPNGIIGGYLPNFPSFREGVALKAYLEDQFGIPVFINNDADLYAYGEALAGALPDLNAQLEAAGSNKRFHNLLGYTFGTGFGFGFVQNGVLNTGDNSCVETFCLKHKHLPNVLVEAGVSIRAVKRIYEESSGESAAQLEPKDICAIAAGKQAGNAAAAQKAFAMMGEVAGDAMATAVTLMDGIIVIGGGLTGAKEFIYPALFKELRGQLHTLTGETLNRLQFKVYNLDHPEEFAVFAKGAERPLKVYGSERSVIYDPEKRIGVMTSKIGASTAISLGAYAYALNKIGPGL